MTTRRTPPPRHAVGLHGVAAALVLAQVCVAAFTFWTLRATGLTVAWNELATSALVVLGVWSLWAYYVVEPGNTAFDWVVAETWLVLALVLSFGLHAPIGQYAAVALERPLIDSWLASADAAIGIHVPSLVAWTRARPALVYPLYYSYNSLLPQLFLPIFVLGFWYRDRAALWAYALQLHLCSVVTLACLAAWPAMCAFSYYGMESILDQTRFIAHFHGIRSGTMTVVHPSDVEGLISFPSFHVAGALMATWAFRRYPAWFALSATVNTGLIAATVLTGAHYAIDVAATVGMFLVSVLVQSRVRLPAHPEGGRQHGEGPGEGLALYPAASHVTRQPNRC